MQIVKVSGVNGCGKTQGCVGAGNAILKKLKEEIFSNEAGTLNADYFRKLSLEEIHLDNSKLFEYLDYTFIEKLYSKII